MKVVILYRTPYYKIKYDEVIDHNIHEVTYIGVADGIWHIPKDIRCKVLVRENKKSLESEVIELLSKEGVTPDRIISINEKEMFSAAKLREHYRLKGTPSSNILKVRDKVLMKKLVSKAGLRTPSFWDLTEFLNDDISFDGKLVLKPKDGVSSTDVLIFDSQNELIKSIKLKSNEDFYSHLYNKHGRLDNYEVEEYISDDIMHFDGVINNGEVIALVASRYLGTCLSYAQGEALGSYQIECTDVFNWWVRDVVNALDIKDGVIHLEAFYTGPQQEPIFLEIANRSGGGGSLVKILKLKTGIFYPHYELSCQMQEYLEPPKPVYHESWFGHFYIPGHHIKSKDWKLVGYNDFINDSRLNGYDMQKEGQPLVQHTSYYNEEIPFDGTIKCKTPEESLNFMQILLKEIRVVNI